MTTSSARAFSMAYGWAVWQCGLAYLATIIGAIISILGGGWLSDKIADWLTRRNNGMREPEMRLPALTLPLILCPLGISLYGVGIGHGFPWIVPVLGLGFCKSMVLHWKLFRQFLIFLVGFSTTQVSSISILYAFESHRPIAGEVVVSQLSFKGEFNSCFNYPHCANALSL